MTDTLRSFVDSSLFDATSSLLAKLRIKFDRETAEPVSLSDFYDGPMPQSLVESYHSVDKAYFIGIINDRSLQGLKSNDSLESVENTIRRGGKYDGMFVFACDIKMDAKTTRTTLATLTRAFNRISSANPVILVFRQGSNLSLATCERMEYNQSWRQGTGEKLGKVTILRNINCEHPHRGHLDILESLGNEAFATFDGLYQHWMEVFSSELLTKKFYGELSDWYAWAVQVAKFPNDLRTNDDDEKYNHESCIRLITRLIFVWFLKQKHLIPEEFFDEGYIRQNLIENFNPHDRKNLLYNPERSQYYRLILQNLFFAMLNCPIVAEGKEKPNNRRFRQNVRPTGLINDDDPNNLMRYESEFMAGGAEKFAKLANTSVPFLNGGLFDCLDNKQTMMFYDGFSENMDSLSQLYLPDWLFFGEEIGAGIDLSQWYDDVKKRNVSARGLIDILKRYSFTIEENTPLDQEVSLDPELLGKVFENLLAAFNPETKTSARKQTGSFYTPREIVQYMVNESLIAHLTRKCGKDDEETYRRLLSYSDTDLNLPIERRREILDALYGCKVLDPACGSGAFPMGVLQQMVHILQKIDPTNEMWNDLMIDVALEETKRELKKAAGNEQEQQKAEENKKARLDDIEKAFNQNINDPDYARKLFLIERCIYGVDIQPIATQISKLRFFITLVADQKPTKDAKSNFGIRPLPNLEAKFVTANTLIPLDREQNIFTASEEILEYEEQLQEINHRIFLAKRNKDKERYRELMNSTRTMMAQALENKGFISTRGFYQLVQWNMFDQNASAPFFDTEWMFGVTDGFDIVIGNPPYIQLQKAIETQNGTTGLKLGDLYKDCNYKTFDKTGDIYCLFYEKGIQSLQEKGILCYITSNKWMRAGYGKKTREYFAKNCNPLTLLDFTGTKVFENATVDVNILILQRTTNSGKTKVANIESASDFKELYSSSDNVFSTASYNSSESWMIVSSTDDITIKTKIESHGKRLGEWDLTLTRGVGTGLDEAYVLTTEQKDELINSCSSIEEKERTLSIIHPMLRGRDIYKYNYVWANLWMIYIPIHFPIQDKSGIKGASDEAEQKFIQLYPTVYKHICKYKEQLSSRDKTETGIRYEWYCLQRARYEKFGKLGFSKIVYQELSQGSTFAIDESGEFLLNNSAYYIHSQTDDKYLIALLNSRLIEYAYSKYYCTKLGKSGVRWLAQNIVNLPIAEATKENRNILASLVDDILEKKRLTPAINTDYEECMINLIVYHIYELTYDEVLLIEPETSITREQYDHYSNNQA